MTSAEQKETVLNFIKAIGASDVSVMVPMLTDDFEFEVMARMPAMPSIIKKADLLGDFGKTMKQMFPNGLKMTFGTVICEGPHVAVQAESHAVAGNGKPYNNRYHFYALFRGDKIALFREYNDTNHAREVFFS
jgi:ketosteroid isomerase-like protein